MRYMLERGVCWRNRVIGVLALGLIPLLSLAGGPGGGQLAMAEEAVQPREGWVAHSKGITARGLVSLVRHAREPDTLYAHVLGMGLARSDDAGKTWATISDGIKPTPDLRRHASLTADPSDARPKSLYAAVDGQIWHTPDGGDSWTKISSGVLVSYTFDQRDTADMIQTVIVNPKKTVHLLAGTRSDGRHHGGLFESSDSGKTWEQIAGSNLASSEVGLDFIDTWMIRLDPKTEKNVFVAGGRHTFFSSDRGRKFERTDPGGEGPHDIRAVSPVVGSKDLFLADSRGIWRSKNLGKKWGKKPEYLGDPVALFFDQHFKKRLWAVFHDQGLAKSDDTKHQKWTPVGEGTGYADLEIRELSFNHRDHKIILAASPVTGLHTSSDRGETFTPVESNLPAYVPGVVHVAVHPAGEGTTLAVTEYGRVFHSTNGGIEWTSVSRLGQAPERLVPGAAAGTWYATGRQLMRSEDDGKTWTVILPTDNTGDTVFEIQELEIDGKPTLRAAWSKTGLVVHSQDGGKTWKPGKAPPISDTAHVAALATDPADPQHMVIAATTTQLRYSSSDTDGGIYETWDGGIKWVDITDNVRRTKKDKNPKAKVNWNRGRFVAIDRTAGLLLYGTEGGGLHARLLVGKEKADRKDKDLNWYRVGPAEAPDTAWSVVATHTVSGEGDATETHYAAEGNTADGRALFRSTSTDLKRGYEFAAEVIKVPVGDKPPPPAWTQAAAPAVPLENLVFDPLDPERLLGSDAARGEGVLTLGGPRKGTEPPEPAAPEGPVEPAGPAPLDPPDGMWGFSASADQEINVWTLRDGKRGKPLRGHGAPVHTVVQSPDETVVVSGGQDAHVRFWDGSSLEPIGATKAPSCVMALAMDPDAERVFAGCRTWEILVLDKESRAITATLTGSSGPVNNLVVSSDGTKLYSAGDDGKVRIWDLATNKETSSIDFGAAVKCLAVNEDGTRIYVAGASKDLKVYGLGGKELLTRQPGPERFSAMALSPDGKQLYVGIADGVQVFDAMTLEPLIKHVGPEKAVLCLTLSADGVWLFAGDADNGLWLWQNGAAKARFNNPGAHTEAVLSVAMTPDLTEQEGSEPAPEPGPAPAPAPDGPDSPDGK